MGLLLRLDCVRGVRDYRKRVIRRVVALQDLVDSLPATVDQPKAAPEAVDPLEPAPVAKEEGMEVSITEKAELVQDSDAATEEEMAETLAYADPVLEERLTEEIVDPAGPLESGIAVGALKFEDGGAAPAEDDAVEEWDVLEEEEAESAVPDPAIEAVVPFVSGESGEEEVGKKMEEARTEMIWNPMTEAAARSTEVAVAPPEKREEGREKMEEAVEMVVRVNRRLERMLEELYERSLEQCRVIEGLAGRLAELERVVGRRRKRKSRRSHSLDRNFSRKECFASTF